MGGKGFWGSKECGCVGVREGEKGKWLAPLLQETGEL